MLIYYVRGLRRQDNSREILVTIGSAQADIGGFKLHSLAIVRTATWELATHPCYLKLTQGQKVVLPLFRSGSRLWPAVMITDRSCQETPTPVPIAAPWQPNRPSWIMPNVYGHTALASISLVGASRSIALPSRQSCFSLVGNRVYA